MAMGDAVTPELCVPECVYAVFFANVRDAWLVCRLVRV